MLVWNQRWNIDVAWGRILTMCGLQLFCRVDTARRIVFVGRLQLRDTRLRVVKRTDMVAHGNSEFSRGVCLYFGMKSMLIDQKALSKARTTCLHSYRNWPIELILLICGREPISTSRNSQKNIYHNCVNKSRYPMKIKAIYEVSKSNQTSIFFTAGMKAIPPPPVPLTLLSNPSPSTAAVPS